MKVYALLHWTPEGVNIIDIYDSREKARKAFFEVINGEYADTKYGELTDDGEDELHFYDHNDIFRAEYELEMVVKEVK